jgi:ABC-2 type transport system ATP-binding protein
VIKVENLTKYYGERLAVDHISFSVDKGEIVGFLGPNAAGKTTTMRILTGFMAPTSGEAWVAGYSLLTNSLEARQHTGYFAESVPLYSDMTVRGYLDFLGKLRGLDKKKLKSRIDTVVEMCHLQEYIDVVIGKMSKGYRQRVGIAQSIIHEPDVLIMDEPTVGIDPLQVAGTRQIIRDLGKEHTVLLSTHILPEVSMTCQRVIIINEGKIVAEDRIENLSSAVTGVRRFRLEVTGPSKQIMERLRRVPGILKLNFDGSKYLLECSAGQDPRSKITEAIVQGGWTLLSLETVEMSLEDVFLKLTAEKEKKE